MSAAVAPDTIGQLKPPGPGIQASPKHHHLLDRMAAHAHHPACAVIMASRQNDLVKVEGPDRRNAKTPLAPTSRRR